jgi:hypothetical protein
VTGASIFYGHHTQKRDMKAQGDWYRGEGSAFRGSGDIAAQLDQGYTLSQYWPPGDMKAGPRKRWKDNHLQEKLGRWIVLDACKVREGKWPDPVVYELVGQEMAEGEGDEIGVCRVSTAAEALACLDQAASEVLLRNAIAEALVFTLGVGVHRGLAPIHKQMAGQICWPQVQKADASQGQFKDIVRMFSDPVPSGKNLVRVVHSGTGKGARWEVEIWEELCDAES